MTFDQFNLAPALLRAIEQKGYSTPTPIQEQAIPVVLQQTDLLGCAQTGTGKTAAFAIPILQMLHQRPLAATSGRRPIRALILTPTRELALQISDNLTDYGRHTRLRHAAIFGGVSQNPQTDALRRGVDILVATPGRLLDLARQGFVHLQHLEILVLDEADRMLDMGFVHDVKAIVARTPVERQTLLLSATLPPAIVQLADGILRNPAQVTITPSASTVELIEQHVLFTERADKPELLLHLLYEHPKQNAIVFTRTKHGADKVERHLQRAGIRTAAIHGNKSQAARQIALREFSEGRLQVLVATDIVARGIDIERLALVVNYDLSHVPEDYVHRIGRTGRAGAAGIAYSLCDPDEQIMLRDIQRLIRQAIPVLANHPYHVPLNVPYLPRTIHGAQSKATQRPTQHNRPQHNQAHHNPNGKSKFPRPAAKQKASRNHSQQPVSY